MADREIDEDFGGYTCCSCFGRRCVCARQATSIWVTYLALICMLLGDVALMVTNISNRQAVVAAWIMNSFAAVLLIYVMCIRNATWAPVTVENVPRMAATSSV